MDDNSDGGERINVNVGSGAGTGTAAPVAPPEPTAPPAAPAGPEPEEETASTPVTPDRPAPIPAAEPEPAPAPPGPGSVVTSGDGTIGGPPTSAVTSGGTGRGKRWLKRLVALILLVAVIAGAWFAYKEFIQKKPAAPKAAVNTDIPLLKIGVLRVDYGKLYPEMSASEYSFMINSQMFEGLVRYEDKSKITPDLASDWTNPDSKTWIFTIRQGIKFHDGNTLGPADVKYSLDKIIASKSDLAQTFADTIASVEVVGTDKVKITTSTPDPTLLNKLAFLYVIDANLPKGQEPSQAGTGPYQIKSGTTPSSTSVQMVAFDGYHGGRPTVRALNFGFAQSVAELTKAYQNGTYNIIGPVPISDAKKYPNASQFISQEPNVFFIGFNTLKAGPLKNKQVRSAIRYALDAQAIGNAAGDPVTPISQLIPETVPGYNPAITAYKQDTAKAKQLLKQAGYPNGFTLTLSTSSSNPGQLKEISDELKAVGITVKTDNHEDFDEFIDAFSTGKTEAFMADYSSDTLDGLDTYNTTLSRSNYDNPELNQLLDEAGTTVDQARRLKLLQDAATIIDRDIPVVAISSNDSIWLMDKPYVIKQDMPSSFMSVYFYKTHNE